MKAMFGAKVSLPKDLYNRADEYAREHGYSSLSELVTHLLEKEMEKDKSEQDPALADRLKGLGYL